MTETDTFAAEVVPLLRAELDALHRGDTGPRLALWSRTEPVTLFGAWLSARSWAEVEPIFARLASTFGGTVSSGYEVIAAESSGDLGYVVALEHNTGVVVDDEPRDYTLRVTTILRREDGEWKVVHRHGDQVEVTAS